MRDDVWSKADCYRQLVDECVALAKTAISNEARAEHYATATYYRNLAEVEANLAGQPNPRNIASELQSHAGSTGR
jgi:hypothetical protein